MASSKIDAPAIRGQFLDAIMKSLPGWAYDPLG
jgi:hypothetical protein